jgi:hypothetical protein
MSTPDWSDTTREDRLRFYDVDPHSLEVRQELTGVELSGSTITWGYYTDTRVSGSIKVLNSNHIDHSLIRVVHTVPDWGYSNPLATLLVTGDDAERDEGAWLTTYECHSTLTMLADDLLRCMFCARKGNKATDLLKNLLNDCGHKYSISGSAHDYRYSSDGTALAFGASALAGVNDVCGTAGDRVDVDGNGVITISAYTTPANITPAWTLDLTDSRTNTLDDITRSSSRLSTPTREIVYCTTTDSKNNSVTYFGYADATTGETAAKRGYTLAEVQSVTDLTSNAAATASAKSYLADNTDEDCEWQIKMLYMPMKTGETAYVTFPDGDDEGRHHCLIKNIELDLSDMVMNVTFKEV